MRRALGLALAVLIALVFVLPTARPADEKQIQQAIERGVEYLKSKQNKDNGEWTYQESGMTSLAGLTLLECGVAADDPAVQKAAAFVRKAAVNESKTYSLALAIMFLDRLGEGVDVALVEAMAARLLAGQQTDGGWSYVSGNEIIVGQQERLKQAVLRGGDGKGERRAPKMDEHRGPDDLSRESKAEIDNLLKRGGPPAPDGRNPAPFTARPDNSNTQFAILGLWTARRYGVPVDAALKKVETRFRSSQNGDGGWGYWAPAGQPGVFNPNSNSTSAMTCAGLLGLAMYHAEAGEAALRAGPKGKDGEPKRRGKPAARDISKDLAVDRGLKYLGGALAASPVKKGDSDERPGSRRPPGIGPPIPGKSGKGFEPPGGFRPPQGKGGPPPGFGPGAGRPPQQGGPPGGMMPSKIGMNQSGRAYYFLWSLERTAVAYGLETIGGKDWYKWGADVLLANQEADGSWNGFHGSYGADTCFALLFLRRADLAKDLSTSLRNKVKDTAVMVSGGVGFKGIKSIKPIRSPFDDVAEGGKNTAAAKAPKRGTSKPPAAVTNADPEVGRLCNQLLEAPPSRWNGALKKLRDGRGSEYTHALALAIGQLDGQPKKKAREALAERLSNLEAKILPVYMADDDPELRRAAALACAMKEDKAHLGELIALLNDPERTVERAAYAALKNLTKQDFGPKADATEADKAKAVKAWKDWWKKQAEK